LSQVLASLLLWHGIASSAPAQEDASRKPNRFAIIFNMGYAVDRLPRDRETFEQVIRTIKDAQFNVVLCAHDLDRAEICKKHDVQMFVDLLVEQHHVYNRPDACKKLCEGLRKQSTIYGYHLWSDHIAGRHEGRTRDVKNVHEWDGTHPAYVGSYNMSKMRQVEGVDLFGYYDFHWTRGGHWAHLSQAFALCKERQVPFLRYDAAKAGIVGKGNPNRVGYTIATSIPFGLKGYMYHYTDPVMDAKTGRLNALGEDLKKVNARFAAVGAELMKLSHPTAVYSTRVTVGANDKPLDVAGVPAGLIAIPEQEWFEVTTGEVVVGLCRDDAKRDVLVLAGHNPYRSQDVTLRLKKGAKKVERFDQKDMAWKALAIDQQQVRFAVDEYAVALVRLDRE
jgi:hypothetical protein